MTLTIPTAAVPLQTNADGVVLVGQTRITLDTVVKAFSQGTTAEEIVYRYPSLRLADVYATIAFYLNHQSEVEAYLSARQQQAEAIKAINQTRSDPQILRDRLLARQVTQPTC
jgi:uncharacterized protein (DUF433 family)